MAKSRSHSKPKPKPKRRSDAAKNPRRYWTWGLWGVAAAAMLALVWLPTQGFPMNEESEITVKVALFVAIAALVTLAWLDRERRGTRRVGTALIVAATLAALAYVNFGAFHGRTYVHYWEHFHYTLGAKYFPELGYDGLYAASLEAQSESHPEFPMPRDVRDLRTNEVLRASAPQISEHREEVRARFSDERWDRFVEDHGLFLDRNTPNYLSLIRRDHGFNPPPSWTFVARLFAWGDIDDEGDLVKLAHLDLLLLIAMFVVVYRTWGARIGSLSLVLFGLGYAGRYYWVGGAFLREDWLAATVIGICLLKRERFAGAGAAFAYATAVRIFPVLFLFGPGIVALRALARRESWTWVWKLIGGFTATLALLFVLGGLTGRGFDAWGNFAESITLHRQTWLTNNVGLENVLLYDGETMRRELVDFSLPEPWVHWQAKMDHLKEDRAAILWAARIAFLALLGLASWRAKPEHAAVLSLGAVFAMVLTTCYYWQALLILPFLGGWLPVVAALALNFGLLVLHFFTGSFEMRYGLMSWGLLALFVALYAPRIKVLVDSWRSTDEGEAEEAVAAS